MLLTTPSLLTGNTHTHNNNTNNNNIIIMMIIIMVVVMMIRINPAPIPGTPYPVC